LLEVGSRCPKTATNQQSSSCCRRWPTSSLRISAVFFPTDDRRLAPDAMPLFPLATEAERSLVPNQLHESLPPS